MLLFQTLFSDSQRIGESPGLFYPTFPKEIFPSLTERERDPLQLIARGLLLSPKTNDNYVSAILSKLQVADRALAIIRAREKDQNEQI